MNEHLHNDSYWVKLFKELYENGISIHHVSLEYKSFNKYCRILEKFYQRYPNTKIHHIIKLAEPNFGDNIFDNDKINKKINTYKIRLFTDKIYMVQWMWRGNLDKDEERISNFLDATNQISNYVSHVKM